MTNHAQQTHLPILKELESNRINLRPFAIVESNPVIDTRIIENWMEHITERIEQISKSTQVPDIFNTDYEGFEGLKKLSLLQPSGLKNITAHFLNQIAKSLKEPLSQRFMEICHTDRGFITDFMPTFTSSTQNVLNEYYKSFEYREFKLLSYGIYQCPEKANETLNCKSKSVSLEFGILADAIQNYIYRFKQLVRFFLFEPWFKNKSIIDILNSYWDNKFNFNDISIEISPLGFPDAYYKATWSNKTQQLFYPSDGNSFSFLPYITPEIAKKMSTELQVFLNADINAKDIQYRLVSWNILSDTGFFRNIPSIQIDGGIPILELVEVLVHELTHHVYHCLTQNNFASHENALCYFYSSCLNEGFAEYHAERCLKEVYNVFPELEFYCLARQILLHNENSEDPHVSGAALINSINLDCLNLNNLLDNISFKLDSLQVTPAFDLSLEYKESDFITRVRGLEFPSSNFIMSLLGNYSEFLCRIIENTII